LLHKIQKEITVQNGAHCFTCKTKDWQKEKGITKKHKGEHNMENYKNVHNGHSSGVPQLQSSITAF